MARVLLISLVFPPDGVSTATIASQLAQNLRERGHELSVLTAVPHYNLDLEARVGQPLRRRWRGLFYRSDYHGIPVWHTAITRKGGRMGGRIGGYLIFHALSFLLGAFVVGKQDVILVVSPPLTSGVVGWMLARLKRAYLVYNVQELYPEVFIKVGELRPGSIWVRVLSWVEGFVYRKAHALTVICEAFARTITNKGVPSTKVHTIPNFVDVEEIRPGAKDNPLARELNLVGHFVVLYAGNIGMTQSFDTLLEVAQRLRDTPEIRLLLVGDGVRRDYIETQVSLRNLTNVVMLPYQPRSRVPEIYATADVCLVPLMAGTATTTVPSKLYTIMASGRPALVAADAESDLAHTVQAANCGWLIPPDDPEALENSIHEAFSQDGHLHELGENGRRYVEAHFSREVITDRYHNLIETLMSERRVP